MVVYPSHANFLAVDVKATGLIPERFVCKLLEKKMFVRQGAYQSRRFADRFIKVSVTVPDADIDRFCNYFPETPDLIRREGAAIKDLY